MDTIRIAEPWLDDHERGAVLRVLESRVLSKGDETRSLESAVAEKLGATHAMAVSSGTAALHLALLAHGVGSGHEVITTPLTFQATINCILHVGARPVFADVHEDGFNVDVRDVLRKVTPRTRAFVPVHLFGRPCDLAEAYEELGRRGVAIVEDAAQAIGASLRGTMVGARGTACFSLYATKNITAGEGGLVVTDDDAVAARVKSLRNHGSVARGDFVEAGFNYRMSELNAAVARTQLARLDEFSRRRRQNARFLSEHLRRVITPGEPTDGVHVFHQYAVRIPSGPAARDQLQRRLESAHIESLVFYPRPAYAYDYVRAWAGAQEAPVAEALCNELLSLPVHPGLGAPELHRIVDCVEAGLSPAGG